MSRRKTRFLHTKKKQEFLLRRFKSVPEDKGDFFTEESLFSVHSRTFAIEQGLRLPSRVATKISRNEIPRYFVLFLFRIFAKILGKFSRKYEIKITIIYYYYLIYFRENVLISSYFAEFRLFGSKYLKENLSQYGGMKVWRLPPPLPELTEVMLICIGGNTGRCCLREPEDGLKIPQNN
jgi:hypothetical protein